MPSQKGFSVVILIVGVAIIAALLFAAFFFGRITSKKENSKNSPNTSTVAEYTPPAYLVYMHPSKGFSFEYPSKWIVKNETGDIYAHATDFFVGDNKVMNLTIIDSPFQTVIASYPQATEIVIGSKRGLRSDSKIFVPLGSFDTSTALFEFANTTDIDHVLSTLKFSEQSSIDDPATWPIYEDKVNGFSFPYPPIFKVEPDNKVSVPVASRINLIYDNPAASGIEPRIPAKIVMEVNLIKTTQKADIYAQEALDEILKNPSYSNSDPGVAADQLGFKKAYRFLIAPKDKPTQTVGYYFLDLENSVLEIIAYYPNTETLKLNNNNILNSVIYKFKLQK